MIDNANWPFALVEDLVFQHHMDRVVPGRRKGRQTG